MLKGWELNIDRCSSLGVYITFYQGVSTELGWKLPKRPGLTPPDFSVLGGDDDDE